MGLYALTARTAAALRSMLGRGERGGTQRAATPAAGETWVRVTGAAVNGWYPAVVMVDEGGSLVDLAAPVWVQASDFSALETNKRYSAKRTGDNPADDRPRFRVSKNRKTVVVTIGPFCVDMTGTATMVCDEFGGQVTTFHLHPVMQQQTLLVSGEDVSVSIGPVSPPPPPF